MTHLHMITTFSFRDPLALPHLLLLLTTWLTLSQPCWPSCFCPLNLRRHTLRPLCLVVSLSKILFSLNTRLTPSVPSGLYSESPFQWDYFWDPYLNPPLSISSLHLCLHLLKGEMNNVKIRSVQFSCSVVSNSLQPHEPQHARPPCPSPTPGVYHVHWVCDAIHPSHPLSSPSPPALNLSQHQDLFKWVSSSHQVTQVREFQCQHQSFQWTPSTDFL